LFRIMVSLLLYLALTNYFGGEVFNVKPIIIVLGYSLNEDCSLSPLLISRLDKALSLYQVGTNMILSGGMPLLSLRKIGIHCENRSNESIHDIQRSFGE